MSHTQPTRRTPQIVAATIIMVLATGIALFGISAYNSQVAAVVTMEHAATWTATPVPSTPEEELKDPRIRAFQNDPVFQSKPWATLIAESRQRGQVLEKDAKAALADKRAGIWWPGLTARADAAAQSVTFDDKGLDRAEFLKATSTIQSSCHIKELAVEERITHWKAKNAGRPAKQVSPYIAARNAVMPELFRAGVKYFCN